MPVPPLLARAATDPAHAVPAAALRTAVQEARRCGDTKLLTLLARRLDLPGDVAAELAADRSADIAAVWAERPDSKAAGGTDPLNGERRAGVLAKMLTSSAPPATRAAIARQFLATPTTTLAHAWLSLDTEDVPVEVVPMAVKHGAGGTSGIAGARSDWMATLPYGSLPEPRGAGVRYHYAWLAAPGADPVAGAGVTDHVTAQLAIAKLRYQRNDQEAPVAAAIAVVSLIAYTLPGRTAPDAALAALRTFASDSYSDPNNIAAAMVATWLTSGCPGLHGTRRPANLPGTLAWQLSHLPDAVSFTTLPDLDACTDDPLDSLDQRDRERWAADTVTLEDLRRLATWALAEPPDPERAGERAEVRYALLTNPYLPADCRRDLLHALTSAPLAVSLQSVRRSAAPLLTQLDGPDRLALYVAGAASHAVDTPLTGWAAEDQAALIAALAALTREDLLEETSRMAKRDPAVLGLCRVLSRPDLHPDAIGHLPWSHAAALTRNASTEPHITAAAAAVNRWLLSEVSARAGESTALWEVLSLQHQHAGDSTATTADTIAATATALAG